MSFAEYQPQYAERGIPTFPVKLVWNEASGKYDKSPAVTNYRKMGRPASAAMAHKFPDAEAFGFCCGPRTKVTVIDYESMDAAREGNHIFGESPLMVRTKRGLHAYYRHNGEPWRIKPFTGLDLDILGEGGGFTVAAPSMGVYEFIRGGLDTLEALPVANIPDALRPLLALQKSKPATSDKLQAGKIPDGQRDKWLFRQLLRHAPHVDDFDALLDVARTLNMDCDPPMDDAQVVAKATSAWGYQVKGKNWVGQKARASTDLAEVLELCRHPGTSDLLSVLRLSHGAEPGKRFPIDQEAVGEMMGCGPVALRSRIATLIEKGKLRRVYTGGHGPHDPHLYVLQAKGSMTEDNIT